MKIKACTFFSDSHLRLYKTFMNSYPSHPDVDLIIRYIPQDGDGEYKEHDSQFTGQMKKKIILILYYLKSLQDDELLFFLDIDVIFYRSFYEDLVELFTSSGKDMLIQTDGPVLCAGQFVVKKTDNVLNLFTRVLEDMDNYKHDQHALNMLLPDSGVSYETLPDRYYSYGAWNEHKRWNGETDFYVPSDIVTHHLNWTVGVDNKMKLSQVVKNMINTRS